PAPRWGRGRHDGGQLLQALRLGEGGPRRRSRRADPRRRRLHRRLRRRALLPRRPPLPPLRRHQSDPAADHRPPDDREGQGMIDQPPPRGLDKLLRPNSIAIIGASDEPSRIGGRPLAYLRAAGFRGPLYPVNSNRKTVQGLQPYPSIGAVPGPVALPVTAVAAEQAVEAVRDCAARGVGAACIFTAGFSEVGPAGGALQDRIAAIARDSGMRVLGPNCLGLFNTENGFYPTFTTTLDRGLPKPGRLSIVSQSGAFGSHIFFTAILRGLGMRQWIATGSEADVDAAECLYGVAEDPGPDVIMASAEGVKHAPRFTAALGAPRARRKPVIFMKVGRSELGAAAVSSHT